MSSADVSGKSKASGGADRGGALAADAFGFLFHGRFVFLPKACRVLDFNRASSGISRTRSETKHAQLRSKTNQPTQARKRELNRALDHGGNKADRPKETGPGADDAPFASAGTERRKGEKERRGAFRPIAGALGAARALTYGHLASRPMSGRDWGLRNPRNADILRCCRDNEWHGDVGKRSGFPTRPRWPRSDERLRNARGAKLHLFSLNSLC